MNELMWGTYGKDGKQPLQYKRLDSLETEHLCNILITESNHISQLYITAIGTILKDRFKLTNKS